VPELLEGDCADDSDGCGVDDLLDAGSGDGRTHDHAPVLVDHEPARYGPSVAEGLGAGYVAGTLGNCSDVESLVTSLPFPSAYGAYLAVRERDPGNDPVVGDVGDVLPTTA
jgi:hypothetical protein